MRRRGGRKKETALLRGKLNKKVATYATRRLLRDLKEIEANTIPTVGVTARPLPDNLFVWHANLRGPEETAYQGGVFHMIMTFPQDYPNSSPEINLCTAIPHPFVFGTKVCLDMLDANKKGLY